MRQASARIEPSALAELVPLNALDPAHRLEVARSARVLELDAGEWLEPGESGEQSDYLLAGTLALYAGGHCLERISSETPEARFALNNLRSERVRARAETPVRLLRLEVSVVSAFLIWAQSGALAAKGGPDESGRGGRWVARLLASELFARVPTANIERILAELEPMAVGAGTEVIGQGQSGEYYYVVREGSFAVTRRTEQGGAVELARLGPGDTFGEEALLSDAVRNATVTAVEDGALLRLTREDFRRLLGEPVVSAVRHAEARALLAAGALWLDVRLPEEHVRDGPPGSINLPLCTLRERAGALERDRTYVICSTSGRRARAAAFVLTGLGFTAHVLEGGLSAARAGDADAGEAMSEAEVKRWSAELEAARAEVAEAFQHKLEATSARRLFEREAAAPSNAQARARLEARRRKLELESTAAGQALAQAQRRKLELEAKLRAAEAQAERRRAEAQAECQALERQAERRLRAESERLEARYAEAAGRLDALKRAEAEVEEKLRRERERLEAEFARSRAALSGEAQQLRAELETLRQEVETRSARIRAESERESRRIREAAEATLREERARLEAEFAASTASLERARHKLERALAAKRAADEEARRVVAAARAEEAKRQAAAEARRREEQERLGRASREASARLESARQAKTAAQQRRREALEKLERLRAGRAAGDGPSDPERSLTAEIERMDASLDEAAASVDAAHREHEQAEATRRAAEARAATERVTEEELRLRLFEEAEAWLREEQARSRAELERAERELAEKWRLKEEAARRRRELARAADTTLVDDVRAQLESGGGDPDDGAKPLAAALAEHAYAEARAELVRDAQAELATDKQRTERALESAAERIARLKWQGLLD